MIEPRTEAMGLRCERNVLRAALGEIIDLPWNRKAKGLARKALEEGRQLRLDVNQREREELAAPQVRRLPQDIFYMENERHRQSRP